MNENSMAEKTHQINKYSLKDFEEKLKNLTTNEEKVRFCLDEMKQTISQDEKPDFRTFWEVKNICLGLFKEHLNSALRIEFWKEYIDLSNEVKRLKNILNEQTTFEVEQIDLAIKSIEEDLNRYNEVLLTIKEIEINYKMKILQQKKEYFIEVQKEITLLNAFAVRVNSLRKEIIKTQMRISSKNKFLKRLGIVGDSVFPKRKKLISEISEEFTNCIEDFVNNAFDIDKIPFYVLREEIKLLQNVAKEFTLNTQAFTNCRLSLSKCWDKVKLAEKSYKKERRHAKELIGQVLEKIEKFKKICENDPDDKSIEKEEKEIFNFIKTLSLRREDLKFLKHKIREAKNPIFQKQQNEQLEKIQKENDKENQRKEKLEKIKKSIVSLLESTQLTLEELQQEKTQIEKDLQVLNPVKFERLILEKQIRALNHLIEDKKENQNINQSDELNKIQGIFEQKKKRRYEIKNQLDNLNKELACSGFDFEKAMIYRDLIDSEKQRLETIDSSIEELEEKIAELESN